MGRGGREAGRGAGVGSLGNYMKVGGKTVPNSMHARPASSTVILEEDTYKAMLSSVRGIKAVINMHVFTDK